MRVRSSVSGEHFPFSTTNWCGSEGEPLDLEWTGRFPRELIASRPPTLWRYREALPIGNADAVVSLGEPVTPLVPLSDGRRSALLKLEYLMPTGSFKDRGSAVMLSTLAAMGVKRIVEDSSGNAGASVAAYAARADIEADIFVPASAAEGKLAQIAASGARLHRVEGDRAATARAAVEAAAQCTYASHVWNPFFLHGTKTFAFEIAEQLGWRAPEAVILPVGNGSLLLGTWLGFSELLSAGIVDSVPRFIGVQAAGCAPLVSAWCGEQATRPRGTIAEGIFVTDPPRADQIHSAIRRSGGMLVAVEDEEIGDAMAFLASRGFLVEPTAAVAVAAWRTMQDSHGEAIIPLTGHGLKDPAAMNSLRLR